MQALFCNLRADDGPLHRQPRSRRLSSQNSSSNKIAMSSVRPRPLRRVYQITQYKGGERGLTDIEPVAFLLRQQDSHPINAFIRLPFIIYCFDDEAERWTDLLYVFLHNTLHNRRLSCIVQSPMPQLSVARDH